MWFFSTFGYWAFLLHQIGIFLVKTLLPLLICLNIWYFSSNVKWRFNFLSLWLENFTSVSSIKSTNNRRSDSVIFQYRSKNHTKKQQQKNRWLSTFYYCIQNFKVFGLESVFNLCISVCFFSHLSKTIKSHLEIIRTNSNILTTNGHCFFNFTSS